MYSDNPDQGELRIVGWNSGWNINAMTKNLYLNRDAGATSNVYIGRANAELQVLANGSVGVGGVPPANFHVFGDTNIEGVLRTIGGIKVDGNLQAHVQTDGSFYRYQGQVYITVDDNLYVRDSNSGEIKFWFNTQSGVLRQDDWTPAALQNGWANYQSGYDQRRLLGPPGRRRPPARPGPLGRRRRQHRLHATARLPPAQPRAALRADQQQQRRPRRHQRRRAGHALSANAGWLSLDGISFRV